MGHTFAKNRHRTLSNGLNGHNGLKSFIQRLVFSKIKHKATVEKTCKTANLSLAADLMDLKQTKQG